MILNSRDFDLEATEARRLESQIDLDSARTPKQRNEWGQFATPPALARDIVQYALKMHHGPDIDFLEPSCGSGAFFGALLGEVADHTIRSAIGVELDKRFASLAAELWGDAGLQVVNDDYTAAGVIAPKSVSLVIANPPYVRHHHLTGEQKAVLVGRSKHELQITPSGLSGLYTYFMLLTHQALAPSATSAWLIPSEFLDVNYGAALKRYLTQHVTLNRIHRFDPSDMQFGDALVTSSVVIFTNSPPAEGHVVTFTHGGSMTSPRQTHLYTSAQLVATSKWSPKFSGATSAVPLERPRFDDFFRIRRGIATGNNAFFVIPRERAESLGILRQHVKPMLPGPRYVKQDIIETDADGYPLLDRQLALVDTSATVRQLEQLDPPLADYLRTVDAKTSSAYLVRTRSPWYKQEQREPAPFVLTYMGRGATTKDPPFRFILNLSQAVTTNMYLMLYPIGPLAEGIESDEVSLSEIHLALRALTGTQLRDGGRVYGGGLHKMEPRELAALDATRIADTLTNYKPAARITTLF